MYVYLRNWGFDDVREWMLGIEATVVSDTKEEKWDMFRTGKALSQYED